MNYKGCAECTAN